MRGDLRRVVSIARVGVMCVVKGAVEGGGFGGWIWRGRVIDVVFVAVPCDGGG